MNTDSDNLIREALIKEEEEIEFTSTQDPGVFEEIIQTFRGRRRWVVTYVWLATFLCTCITFAAGYQFYLADTTKAQIGWAAGFLYFALVVAMLKIWYWDEMRRYTYLREIKRLEIQVANLAEKLE